MSALKENAAPFEANIKCIKEYVKQHAPECVLVKTFSVLLIALDRVIAVHLPRADTGWEVGRLARYGDAILSAATFLHTSEQCRQGLPPVSTGFQEVGTEAKQCGANDAPYVRYELVMEAVVPHQSDPDEPISNGPDSSGSDCDVM